ncbi:Unknown protein [Striga hermonthica]|uniref:Integrase catalytic domain-containing protein n=1 Tax=Striga hermonthica TaxID=68872 RepID=A0A9N7NQG6_STRHE|nr:Unknown protein [Striga hermonthica]
MEVESLGGSRYFVTFIDDASRKLWVYFLRTKDEVSNYFKRFHAMVEKQTGNPLKCLCSDNGEEYSSHEFKNYCADHGIRHEKTVPGTPQHNGVAKRINRTIMEKDAGGVQVAHGCLRGPGSSCARHLECCGRARGELGALGRTWASRSVAGLCGSARLGARTREDGSAWDACSWDEPGGA